MKSLTATQLQARKDKPVRFLRDVFDDPDRAAEVEDEDLEDYADRRKISIVNRGRSNQKNMAGNGGNGKTDPRTKQDLLDEIDDLTQENEDLQSALDSIADIAAPQEEEEEDEADDTVYDGD